MPAQSLQVLSELTKSDFKQKQILSPLKKCVKKLSFTSSGDLSNLADLAYWLYVFGYHKEALKVTQIIDPVPFAGNFNTWSRIENLLLLQVRILREQGNETGAAAARAKVLAAMQGHDEAFRRRLSFSWLGHDRIARYVAAGDTRNANISRFSDIKSLLFIRETGTNLKDLDNKKPDIEGAEQLIVEYCKILSGKP